MFAFSAKFSLRCELSELKKSIKHSFSQVNKFVKYIVSFSIYVE